MSLSASRWICLLAMTVVVHYSASQVDSRMAMCCNKSRLRLIKNIQHCYEQQPRLGCPHAYVIRAKGTMFCINPSVPWIKNQIASGNLKCPPEFTVLGRFEDLEEDDVN